MIDVRVLLVQFFDQALSLLLVEPHRPGPESPGDAALPVDRVGFHINCDFQETPVLGPTLYRHRLFIGFLELRYQALGR